MNEQNLQGKVYFTPGDVVVIRHAIGNVPKMVVKGVSKGMIKTAGKSILFGVSCYWFDTNQQYQESVFNTKDLEVIVKNDMQYSTDTAAGSVTTTY
jgi:uncharacterized protein YodC (DUF2158 family)